MHVKACPYLPGTSHHYELKSAKSYISIYSMSMAGSPTDAGNNETADHGVSSDSDLFEETETVRKRRKKMIPEPGLSDFGQNGNEDGQGGQVIGQNELSDGHNGQSRRYTDALIAHAHGQQTYNGQHYGQRTQNGQQIQCGHYYGQRIHCGHPGIVTRFEFHGQGSHIGHVYGHYGQDNGHYGQDNGYYGQDIGHYGQDNGHCGQDRWHNAQDGHYKNQDIEEADSDTELLLAEVASMKRKNDITEARQRRKRNKEGEAMNDEGSCDHHEYEMKTLVSVKNQNHPTSTRTRSSWSDIRSADCKKEEKVRDRIKFQSLSSNTRLSSSSNDDHNDDDFISLDGSLMITPIKNDDNELNKNVSLSNHPMLSEPFHLIDGVDHNLNPTFQKTMDANQSSSSSNASTYTSASFSFPTNNFHLIHQMGW